MAQATEIIAVLINEDDGVEIHVAKVAGGYSVVLFDVDSGEYLPSVMIYPNLDRAMAYAHKSVN